MEKDSEANWIPTVECHWIYLYICPRSRNTSQKGQIHREFHGSYNLCLLKGCGGNQRKGGSKDSQVPLIPCLLEASSEKSMDSGENWITDLIKQRGLRIGRQKQR